MPKITSKAQLVVGTELTINTAAKTFTLNPAGNLVAKDGVTLQAVYSKFVELWTAEAYNEFPFPMYAIDALSGQFQFGTDGSTFNGWKPANDTTRQMLRDGGWSEYTAAGALARQYVGIVSLGVVNTGAQLYYQKVAAGAASNFTFTDAANEGIQVFGNVTADATTTTFDNRTYFKAFVREYGKKYKDSVLADTGKTSTGANLVNMLLSNEDDLSITANDAAMTSSPYADVTIKYLPTPFSRDVDTTGTPRAYGIVIDIGTHSSSDGVTLGTAKTLSTAGTPIPVPANYVGGTLTVHSGVNKGTYGVTACTATLITTDKAANFAAGTLTSFTLQRAAPVVASLAQVYTKIQFLLRQATDIDATTAGTVTGRTASLLVNFVGATLQAGFYTPTNPSGGGSGVLLQGVSAADVNAVEMYDNTAAKRTFPYAAAGTINSNAVLVAGATGYYRMYFTTNPAGDYGTATAVTVNDNSGQPIAGVITGSTLNFTFDYDGNTQGGRTPGADAAVTIVAGNKGSAKPVVSTAVLTRSKAVTVSLVAEQDRAYQ